MENQIVHDIRGCTCSMRAHLRDKGERNEISALRGEGPPGF